MKQTTMQPQYPFVDTTSMAYPFDEKAKLENMNLKCPICYL